MLTGFNNHHSSEAIEGALPKHQNSPQRTPFGLYAEQITGTAFTAPKPDNRRTWVYRRRPSVMHQNNRQSIQLANWVADRLQTPVEPMRWSPMDIPAGDFATSLQLVTQCGGALQHAGAASLIFNTQGQSSSLQNHDGEMALIPVNGKLTIVTELGEFELEPGYVGVIPRGMIYSVASQTPVYGYALENYGAPLTLPERGPVGANCLANERDFEYPHARLQDEQPTRIIVKSDNQFTQFDLDHTPYDVAAWHGNLAPYRYDLRRFNTLGSISYDHPDPSIFTVLTSPSAVPGTANIDVVVFNERWLVADKTFRPPWYHRNVMSEFMGLVLGQYDAKPEGFVVGGCSLHNAGAPHGPDHQAYNHAVGSDLTPTRLNDTLAFMFETGLRQQVPQSMMDSPALQPSYPECWNGLEPVSLEALTGAKK